MSQPTRTSPVARVTADQAAADQALIWRLLQAESTRSGAPIEVTALAHGAELNGAGAHAIVQGGAP